VVFAGRCPPRGTIPTPRNALIPKRESCRAKRCPHISTRKCVSAARDASWLARGRLTTDRGCLSGARDRSDGPRGRSSARRSQLFVRFGALMGARGPSLVPPHALGRVAVHCEHRAVDSQSRAAPATSIAVSSRQNGGHLLRCEDSFGRPSLLFFSEASARSQRLPMPRDPRVVLLAHPFLERCVAAETEPPF